MSENTVQSQNLPGALGGARRKLPPWGNVGGGANTSGAAPEPTIIDLRKPDDLNLVYRSVLNGWDVPQHVRDQIGKQMISAIDFHSNKGDQRSTSRVIKLCKLMLLMDVSNRVDAGERKSLHPFGRKRYPEKRKPRHLSTHDAAQANDPSRATDGGGRRGCGESNNQKKSNAGAERAREIEQITE